MARSPTFFMPFRAVTASGRLQPISGGTLVVRTSAGLDAAIIVPPAFVIVAAAAAAVSPILRALRNDLVELLKSE